MDNKTRAVWARLTLFPSIAHPGSISWALCLGHTRNGVPHASLTERGVIAAVPGVPLETQAREALFAVARECRAG